MTLRRTRARILGVAVAAAALTLAPSAWTTVSSLSPAIAGGTDKAGSADQKAEPATMPVLVAASQESSVAKAPASARGQAASELGKLKAARTGAQAKPGSTTGQIATYESQMPTALAIEDPAQRMAAIAAARQALAQAANKQLTGPAIARVDSVLGLPASAPTLGTGPSAGRNRGTPPSAQALAHGKAASALLNLSDVNTPAKASSLSKPSAMVGQIAAYESQMQAALAMENRAQRAAAVAAARTELGRSTDRQLTPAAITRVDKALGLPATPTDLGMTVTTANRR